MTTRITNNLVTNTFINQLFEKRESIEEAREKLSTGAEVRDASDDPGRAGSISLLNETSTRIERHKQRIVLATGILTHQEDTVSSAQNIMIRAKELATQAANGSQSTESRAIIAEEVFQLRDALIGLANTQFQGQYVYGGAANGSPPFTQSTYAVPTSGSANERFVYTTADGADQVRNVQIGDSESIALNTPGDDVFSFSVGVLERLGRILSGFRSATNPSSDPPNLPTGVETGGGDQMTFPADFDEQTSSIQTLLDDIDSAVEDDLQIEQTNIGARLTRLQQATQTLDTLGFNTTEAKASLQDADVFQVASDLANLETSLEGLLAAGVQVTRLSLLDFL